MRLLIIDDEEKIRRTTRMMLESMGHEAVGVDTGQAALQLLGEGQFDVVFLDLKLKEENGLELLPQLLQSNPKLDVVVFTAFATIETAVQAIRCGAADYIPKPFTPEEIRQVLSKLNDARQLKGRLAELEDRISHDSPAVDLATKEPEVEEVYKVAFKAAATAATLIILGESGTGKTVLARAIHDKSPQQEHPFITVNCPSLSRELLESELFGHVKGAFTGAHRDTWGKVALAEGGTLFLDEIGELPLEIQPKLLRLLQEREYERIGEAKPRRAKVRIVAATNKDLEEAVRQGQFREDLYYRLNVISLTLPPLRERQNDLMSFAHGYNRFFAQQCRKRIRGFTPEAEKAVKQYHWPGNLRELRNAVERAVILCEGESIEVKDLPVKVEAGLQNNAPTEAQVGGMISLDKIEQEHIRRVLHRVPTLEEAARILEIDTTTLYRKRKKFGY